MSEFKGMYPSIKATNPKGVHRAIIQTQRQISLTQLTAVAFVMKSLKNKKYYEREGMFGTYIPEHMDGTPRGDVAGYIVDWAVKNEKVNILSSSLKISAPYETVDMNFDLNNYMKTLDMSDPDEASQYSMIYDYLIEEVATKMNAVNTRKLFNKMNREELGKFFETAKLAMGLTSSQFNSMIDSPTDYSMFAIAASQVEEI